MNSFVLFLAEGESSAPAPTGGFGGWSILLVYAVLIFAMWFFLIRPNSKRKKEEQKMRENIQVGDAIITIGGIMGRVVSLKEESILMETGADRVKIRIKKWAVQSNETVHDDD